MIRAVTKIIAGGLFLALVSATAAKAVDTSSSGEIAVTAIDLGDPSESVIGQALAYPQGKPAFKALKVTIPPGKTTALHLHEVNNFAYVLGGTLEVDYGSKGTKQFGPGEGFLEAVGWCHKGRAVGDAPAVVLVLYLGAPSLENTVGCK